jgi:hypothetical protein
MVLIVVILGVVVGEKGWKMQGRKEWKQLRINKHALHIEGYKSMIHHSSHIHIAFVNALEALIHVWHMD